MRPADALGRRRTGATSGNAASQSRDAFNARPLTPSLTLAPPSTGSVTPVMKLASSDARNNAALATSQPVPIFLRSGTWASRSASTSARVFLNVAGAGVDRHRRVHQAGQDDVGADAVLRVLVGELLGEGDHRGLGRLVGDVGIGRDHGHRGDVDDHAALLLAHDRDHVLGGEDAALEVDRHAAVERLLGDVEQLGVAAGQARRRHCCAGCRCGPSGRARRPPSP